MPIRICPQPGCPLIATECTNPEHTAGGWTPDHTRGTKTQRGYGRQWTQARARALHAQPRCTCGAPATTVDHVIPLAEGGTHHPSNLRPLCNPCHTTKTSQDAARGRARAKEGRS